jgi:diaminopimelate decarboxylase
VQASGDAPPLRPWWSRPGLEVRDGRLEIAGRDAESIALELGTPRFVYDLVRIEEQVRALQASLERAGLRHRVRLALKAQREPEALATLRSLGPPGSAESVGIDACSPEEVLHALDHGWRGEEISYTGTNVSERDLDVLLAHPIHLNVDLLSQLQRIGRRDQGRAVGLRINPRAGAGYRGGDTLYSGRGRPTKFGIFPEQLDEAVDIARGHGLGIDAVHFHVGDGYLTDGLPQFERAVECAAQTAERLIAAGHEITEVNVGGGLGVPVAEGDEPLDLDAWASMLARHLAPLDVVVAVEPGDFLVKESAILLAQIVTVEDREGVRFVGVDAGWNVMNEKFIYRIPQQIVACALADAPAVRGCTIAGHINEGDDLFAEDEPLPEVREGDVLAVLRCGSYAQSMTIVHCLRPPAPASFFNDRRRDP